MDKQQQRIAIAEACGLFRLKPLRRTTRKGKVDPNGVRLWYCSSHHGGAGEYTPVPDYPNDLNAMHEAEEVLNDKQLASYGVWLEGIRSSVVTGFCRKRTDYFQLTKVCRATAAQRAEAFLKTLNLWKP